MQRLIAFCKTLYQEQPFLALALSVIIALVLYAFIVAARGWRVGVHMFHEDELGDIPEDEVERKFVRKPRKKKATVVPPAPAAAPVPA